MRLNASQKHLLSRLTNGPKNVRMFSHGDSGSSQMSFHFPKYLKEMEEAGYVFQDKDENWGITKLGRDYLDQDRSRYATGDKFTTWKRDQVYDGRELRHNHTRPGCYDFLNCPSYSQGKRTYREMA